jgi:glycosyltransferase involved in cell wall biosynthesis
MPRSNLRVVHFVLALNVGGLERVVIDLARRMDPTRFRITVVCIKKRGPRRPGREVGDTCYLPQLRGAGPWHGLVADDPVPETSPAGRTPHPQPYPHIVGSVAAAVLRIPVVINTKHGRNNPERRNAVLVNRTAALLSDAVVAVSSDAARVATDVEFVPRRKVRTIHNGIDLVRFPFRDQPGPQRGRAARAIHVARLDTIKD